MATHSSYKVSGRFSETRVYGSTGKRSHSDTKPCDNQGRHFVRRVATRVEPLCFRVDDGNGSGETYELVRKKKA